VCQQAIQKRLVKMRITRKKMTFVYSERSEEQRAKYQRRLRRVPKGKRVYVDECGVHTCMTREYGRAPAGVKVEDSKRGRDFHRVNVVAAIAQGECGMKKIAPMCYQGSMTAGRFERWMESRLLKSVERGSTVIMDNASFHRKAALRELCRKAGVHLLFLPTYSPDLNPIEKCWANMKRALRDSASLHPLLETAILKYWS